MLSYVIPALNEEQHILRCLRSIGQHSPPGEAHEVFVADNGSTDNTAALAVGVGAHVIATHAVTIGGVRNDAVAAANGDILIFLDADCALTPAWQQQVARVLSEVRAGTFACAGSQVFPPAEESTFIWKHWFVPFVSQTSASHIGSAHLICSRAAFERIGGFDERLETGEDYDFCTRIQAAGGKLLNDPALRVEHYGFPRTWGEFWKRERWHGRGDATTLVAFLRSKIAVTSVAFMALLVTSVFTLAAGLPVPALAAGASAAVLLAVTSIVKFRHAGPTTQLLSLSILMVYFSARAMAVVDGLLRSPTRRSRSAD